MDFEMLTRRDLQALCKKNKIPANITNVAMIDALKALSFVEGIEELMQQSQSENGQSSVESPDRKEVTTVRRNAAKEEPETVQPLTRTRRTTRKTLAKDAVEDTTETPSVAQTTTRRARVNSVCRKMDSQLKECEEEDKKKGALATPAPSGVTSRRRRGVKEESVIKREYSTRRSVRLAEKKVEVLDEVENEKSAPFKSEFFAKDGENVNVSFEECLDNVEETSEINTGNYANATLEENPEEMDESVQNHHVQVCEESDVAATVENLEGKDESESVPDQEQHTHTVTETEKAATFEEERGQKSEADDLKLDGEKVLSKAMDVDENLEGNDELEVVVSVKEICEDQDMGFEDDPDFDVNEEQRNGEISEISLMNEADDESAMPESFVGSDSHLNVKPTCLTPYKEVYARRATPIKNSMTITSDNKENTKVVLREETAAKNNNTAENVNRLNDLSVRKLTKMLREKLQITNNKLTENENINEARGRLALQTLPENQLAD